MDDLVLFIQQQQHGIGMQQQYEQSGQGRHPPLNRSALPDCALVGNIADMLDTLVGCWITGIFLKELCAAGGKVTDSDDIMMVATED